MSGKSEGALAPMAVVATLVLGAVLAAASYGSAALTALVVGGLGLLGAYGWDRVLDLPSPRGVRAVLAGTAVAVAALSLAGERDLRWVPVALAGALVGSFLHQLLRTDGRPRLVETLSGTALGAALIGGGACFIGAQYDPGGPLLVSVCAVATVLGVAIDVALQARPAAAPWALPVGMALAGVLGLAAAALKGVPVVPVFAAAMAAAALSHAVRRVLTQLPTARGGAAQVSVAALSLLVVGIVPFVASHV